MRTRLTLEFLIPRLYSGIGTQEKATPLWLTVGDVQVIKTGLATLIDILNRKQQAAKVKNEMQRLKMLKNTIEQTFKITQD